MVFWVETFFSDICTQFKRFVVVGSVSISISNCFDESFERRILSESPSLQSRRFLLLFSAGLPTLPLAHATVTSRKNRAQIFLFLDPPATEDPIFFCILLEENVHICGQHAIPTVGWGVLVWIFQWWLKRQVVWNHCRGNGKLWWFFSFSQTFG